MKRISGWHQLAAFAKEWNNPVLSRFVQAETNVALNRTNANDPVARYREVNLFPGALQTSGYIEALCRGAGLTTHWTEQNKQLRLARQRLLQMSGVRQEFFVDEAALTYWPGGFKEVVGPTLLYALHELRSDIGRADRLHFRVIPTNRAAALPNGVYKDAFDLFKLGDTAEGFTEPWPFNRIEEAEGDKLALLQDSWNRIGDVALSRADSIDLLQAKLTLF